MSTAYLVHLQPCVPLDQAEMSLHLAMFAVEGLAGRARVCIDARYELDQQSHAIAIVRNRIGQMIVRAFAALLLREFGEGMFRVERVRRGKRAHEHRQPQETNA